MRGWRNRVVWSLLAGLVLAASGADAAEPMDTYRRADALYQQGRSEDACRLLAATSSAPLSLGGPVADGDYEMLARLAKSSARHAAEAARTGQRAAAIQAASAGMALSRQLMERPDAGCQDVRSGIALWLIAGEGLEQAWRELGSIEHAHDAAEDVILMDRFARSVVLPRCESLAARSAPRDTRVEIAEARALVRLWAYHLIRVAADNIN